MSAMLALAVDDDPINLHIIESTFEDDPGIELRFAASGVQALVMLEDTSTSYDVVILDRMMAGIDGMEVLRRIKGTPRLAHVPVVMQTASAAAEEVEEGLRAGAHYYLTKPYTPGALRSVVHAAIEQAALARSSGVPQLRTGEALRLTCAARFECKTMAEADELAMLLASLSPEPSSRLLGFRELLFNAIEHGNFGLDYEDKARLKRDGDWELELERRALLPPYCDRLVRVSFERTREGLRFEICDEGDGFEWQRYLELDPARAFDLNGRGIALAKALCFDDLTYRGCGNVAVATIAFARASAS